MLYPHDALILSRFMLGFDSLNGLDQKNPLCHTELIISYYIPIISLGIFFGNVFILLGSFGSKYPNNPTVWWKNFLGKVMGFPHLCMFTLGIPTHSDPQHLSHGPGRPWTSTRSASPVAGAVSSNRATPQWMVYDGKYNQNRWFRGNLLCRNSHMVLYMF